MTLGLLALKSKTMARKETNFKQTDLGLIPHDWEVVSLGEYTRKIGSGKTPRGGEAVYTLSGIPFVRSQNVGYGRMHLKGLSYISTALHNEQKSSEIGANDVLLNITGASIGRCSVADKYVVGGNVNQHVCIIRVDPSSFTSSFLCNFLLSNNGQEQIQLLQSGGSREGINFGQLGNIKVPLPPTIEEQRRIAEVLSHFDEHIDNLVALLEKRKQVKSATMHALLSGATRLPGFTEPWQEVTLKKLCLSMNSGGTPNSKNPKFYGGDIPFLSIADMTLQGKYVSKTAKTITNEGLVNSSARLVRRGVLLYAMYASLGKCSLSSIDLAISQAILAIETNPKLLNTNYLYYYLTFIEETVKSLGQTGTQTNLSKQLVKGISIVAPTSVEEQKAIVSILSNMDRGVEVLEQRIEKYRQMKDGAMEELLTGKTRLL